MVESVIPANIMVTGKVHLQHKGSLIGFLNQASAFSVYHCINSNNIVELTVIELRTQIFITQDGINFRESILWTYGENLFSLFRPKKQQVYRKVSKQWVIDPILVRELTSIMRAQAKYFGQGWPPLKKV